ncbi:MAG: SRPBCC family protein [Acidimicrobiia bacterium]
MPDQTFQHSVTTSTGADKVWKALDQPATWEAIPGVDRVTDPVIDEAGRLQGFAFESFVGGKRYVGQAAPAGREEGRLTAWDIVTSEIRGRVTVDLEPVDEGTRVGVALSVEGVGLMGSLFFPMIASAIGSGYADTVDEFVNSLRT